MKDIYNPHEGDLVNALNQLAEKDKIMTVQNEIDKLEQVIQTGLVELRQSYNQYNRLVESLLAIVDVDYANVWAMKMAMLNIIRDSVHFDTERTVVTPNPKE